MSEIRVIPLICPDCGQTLLGLRNDRIFFCMQCQQGLFSTGEKEWDRYPLRFAEVANPPAQVIHLPVWEIKITAEAQVVNRQQEVSLRRLEEIKSVWVAGFTLIRASYFGDLGLYYTERGVSPVKMEGPPTGQITAGCTRTIEDALRYADLFVKTILDRRADITGLDLEIKTRDAAIWAIPFSDQGDKIIDLIMGNPLPAFAIDDLEGLRRLRAKRPAA